MKGFTNLLLCLGAFGYVNAACERNSECKLSKKLDSIAAEFNENFICIQEKAKENKDPLVIVA